MKTIKLTEESLKGIISEIVRQIADRSEVQTGEIDVPAFEVSREIKNLSQHLDGLAEKYLGKYEQTGEKLYDSFGSKLYAVSEALDKFMEENGYDSALRRTDRFNDL